MSEIKGYICPQCGSNDCCILDNDTASILLAYIGFLLLPILSIVLLSIDSSKKNRYINMNLKMVENRVLNEKKELYDKILKEYNL